MGLWWRGSVPGRDVWRLHESSGRRDAVRIIAVPARAVEKLVTHAGIPLC